MAQYILRNLPNDLWRRVSKRAAAEGWPKRALMLRLLEDYADTRLSPSGAPPIHSTDPSEPAETTPADISGRNVLVIEWDEGDQVYDHVRCSAAMLNGATVEAHDELGRVIGQFRAAGIKRWWVDHR